MAGLEYLSDQGFRLDGRKPDEPRQIRCRLGGFTQSDGSAYVEQGNTKVVATVYGPHEIRVHRSKTTADKLVINCEYSMATFSTTERKRRPRGDRKSQEMSMHLRQTFEAAIITERYPKSQIDIFVQVLQADGGNYSACVNAATLALIDAGVSMKDYVCSCSIGWANETPLVDISYLESGANNPELYVAVLPRSEQVVFLQTSSRIHLDNLDKMLQAAIKGCQEIFRILDQMKWPNRIINASDGIVEICYTFEDKW
ncbi:hypothetical protein CHUAL_003138 [Chamberlinius hualienensis]